MAHLKDVDGRREDRPCTAGAAVRQRIAPATASDPPPGSRIAGAGPRVGLDDLAELLDHWRRLEAAADYPPRTTGDYVCQLARLVIVCDDLNQDADGLGLDGALLAVAATAMQAITDR